MKYAILIYGDEKRNAEATPEQWQQVTEAHRAFAQRHGEKISGGQALQPTETATTIRKNGSSFVLSDGPFAETKEQFGGFYLIDCEDMDEAINIAKDLPVADSDALEIRPVMVVE